MDVLTGQRFGAFIIVESLLYLDKLLGISIFTEQQVKFSITVISFSLSDDKENVVDLNVGKE